MIFYLVCVLTMGYLHIQPMNSVNIMLNFSYLSDTYGSKPSLFLNDKSVELLSNAFLYLEKKTGIYIDPYGTTKVYPDHQKILINYLSDNENNEIKKILAYFREAISQDEVILADGD